MTIYHASNVEVRHPMLVSPAVVGILADHLKLDETAAIDEYIARRDKGETVKSA